MEKTFVIAWKCRSEPRWGQGKKRFTREEAQALAEEMNRDYPAFVHEAIEVAANEPALAIVHVDFQSAPELGIPVIQEGAGEAVPA